MSKQVLMTLKASEYFKLENFHRKDPLTFDNLGHNVAAEKVIKAHQSNSNTITHHQLSMTENWIKVSETNTQIIIEEY